MKVARDVAHVAQEKQRSNQRRHHEVSVYKEPGSEFYYYRVRLHGKRYKRSTNQTTLALALKQAKMIRAELLEGKQRETMKRPGYATVGDVLAVWMARSPAMTRANNRSTLRKWVRSFAAGDPDEVSMTRITAEAFERYLRAWPGSPDGRASTWRQIRAVFAEQPMRWYRQAGLVLPDLADFRLVRAEMAAREQRVRGYRPIGAETLARMDRWAERLRRSKSAECRRVWAVYVLMRRCGLRNIEVAALRWEWLRKGQRHYKWAFERQRLEDGSYYMPKGTAREVPVHWRVVGQLRRALQSRSGFVIPRSTPTDAEVLTERTINRFVRRFVPDRTKGAYELRKQFGAEYCRRHGIEATAIVMGHEDIKTTWEHYHALLNEPAPL